MKLDMDTALTIFVYTPASILYRIALLIFFLIYLACMLQVGVLLYCSLASFIQLTIRHQRRVRQVCWNVVQDVGVKVLTVSLNILSVPFLPLMLLGAVVAFSKGVGMGICFCLGVFLGFEMNKFHRSGFLIRPKPWTLDPCLALRSEFGFEDKEVDVEPKVLFASDDIVVGDSETEEVDDDGEPGAVHPTANDSEAETEIELPSRARARARFVVSNLPGHRESRRMEREKKIRALRILSRKGRKSPQWIAGSGEDDGWE